MFAQNTNDFVGQFDSASERDVARSIVSLSREQKIGGVIPHPQIGGIYADFLIQVGPDAESYSSKELVLIEYDGLGIKRTNDLEKKIDRYGGVRRLGIDVRWVFDTEKTKVEDQIFHADPPSRVKKTLYCPKCGEEEDIIVLTPKTAEPEIRDTFISCPNNCDI